MEEILNIIRPIFGLSILWFIFSIMGGWKGVTMWAKGMLWFCLLFLPAYPLAYISGVLSVLWVVGALVFLSRNGGGDGDGGVDGSNY
jgi:hypothetical protein